VLARRPGSDVRASARRIERTTAGRADVRVAPGASRRAIASAERSPIAVVGLQTSGDRDVVADLAVDLREELGVGTAARDGVELYLVGQEALWAGMQDLTKEDLQAAETVGFPLVLLILLAVFGSLAAALLPLVLGFSSVMITGAAIFALSRVMEMSIFVTNIASMIGIGVAVDYSLFLLARYREEIRTGARPEDARRMAMRTSGVAVVFSGLTVMISLAGLFLVDSTTIRSMALGAIVVVAIAVLAAVTLLPALIAMLGRRAHERGRVARAVRLLGRGPRARRGSTAPQYAALVLLGALDGSGHPSAGRHRRPLPGGAAPACHPGAVAGVRQRRAAPVPCGSRDADRRRACGMVYPWQRRLRYASQTRLSQPSTRLCGTAASRAAPPPCGRRSNDCSTASVSARSPRRTGGHTPSTRRRRR